MPRSLAITLEGSPPVALRKNRASTTHWDRHREAKHLRNTSIALWLEAMGSARPVYASCVVTITQYWCGKPLDYDGLASGVAPCVDALQDVGVIEDDQPGKNIVDYRLRYERVPHMADRRWTVTVEEEEARLSPPYGEGSPSSSKAVRSGSSPGSLGGASTGAGIPEIHE